VTAQAAFLPPGILTTVLGPMLPILIARWALSDTQAIARRARMVPACAQGLDSGAQNARLAGNGGQVALAISESSSGRTLRRDLTGSAPAR
jgi:hypothetical protein